MQEAAASSYTKSNLEKSFVSYKVLVVTGTINNGASGEFFWGGDVGEDIHTSPAVSGCRKWRHPFLFFFSE